MEASGGPPGNPDTEPESRISYLESFKSYLQNNQNQIAVLLVVTQRPRELTRSQLKELRILLDQAGYSETALRTA